MMEGMDNKDTRTVGERIKARRKAMNMSIATFAGKIGRDRTTAYRYERGNLPIPDELVMPIADILDMEPGELVMQKPADDPKDAVCCEAARQARVIDPYIATQEDGGLYKCPILDGVTWDGEGFVCTAQLRDGESVEYEYLPARWMRAIPEEAENLAVLRLHSDIPQFEWKRRDLLCIVIDKIGVGPGITMIEYEGMVGFLQWMECTGDRTSFKMALLSGEIQTFEHEGFSWGWRTFGKVFRVNRILA